MSRQFREEDTRLQPDEKYKGILHPPRASRIREEDLTLHNRHTSKTPGDGADPLLGKLAQLFGSIAEKVTSQERRQYRRAARRSTGQADYSTRYQPATAPSARTHSGYGRHTGFGESFLWKVLIACVAIALVSVIAIPTSFAKPTTPITINDGGRVMEAETAAETVGEFLQDNMIILSEDDVLETDPALPITEGMEILIRRAMPITIKTGTESITVNMASGTVAEALQKAGVHPAETDEVYPAHDTFLRAGMKIDHIVVTTDTRTEYREIPFTEEVVEDSKLAKGKTEVRQQGQVGEYELIFAQVFKNGMLMPEEVASEQTVKEPVKKITAVGTYVPPPPKKTVKISEIHKGSSGSKSSGKKGSGGGKVEGPGTLPDGVSYQYAVSVSVTAYCAGCNSGSSTASGATPSQGTVAAKLGQFPMGTKLFIPGYGYGRVEDTGGFGAGTIDLFLPGRSSCTCGNDWGRKSLTVYVL